MKFARKYEKYSEPAIIVLARPSHPTLLLLALYWVWNFYYYYCHYYTGPHSTCSREFSSASLTIWARPWEIQVRGLWGMPTREEIGWEGVAIKHTLKSSDLR